jgi:hypothetical protein
MNDEAKGKLEQLTQIQDPNEFLRQYRRIFAETNGMAESALFPLSDDSSGDIIEGFIGVWLAMRSKLPIKSKEQIIEAINDLIRMMEEAREYVPDDSAEIERDVRRCLRKGWGKMLKG